MTKVLTDPGWLQKVSGIEEMMNFEDEDDEGLGIIMVDDF